MVSGNNNGLCALFGKDVWAKVFGANFISDIRIGTTQVVGMASANCCAAHLWGPTQATMVPLAVDLYSYDFV